MPSSLKAEDCKVEPTESEERGTELKTETKEEEDQPSTSATQPSPAPGQSKKKSKFLRPGFMEAEGKLKTSGRVRLGFLGLGIELSCDFIKPGALGLVFITTNVGEGVFFL